MAALSFENRREMPFDSQMVEICPRILLTSCERFVSPKIEAKGPQNPINKNKRKEKKTTPKEGNQQKAKK